VITPILSGIGAEAITTSRLTTRVLSSGPDDGEPVLFLHGNLSSATWWETTMLRLPARFRAVASDQRGFGEADPLAKIDARRGLGDLADDAIALLDKLNIDRAHLVGNSMGGGVVWHLMANAPDRILTVTQVSPGSPYGFGGTKDNHGTPCWDDFAGSGGGLVNPELVDRLESSDAGTDSQFSPRNVLRNFIVVPGSIPENEDGLVAGMLTTHLGQQAYPGDMVPSGNWPFVSPGIAGINNAQSPKYLGDLVERLLAPSRKPAVAWIRGDLDKVVADNAIGDPGTLGALGLIPDWPGAESYPAQPMLAQTRSVLDQYQASGGSYTETTIEGAAHVPFIECPATFDDLFHAHIENPGGNTI